MEAWKKLSRIYAYLLSNSSAFRYRFILTQKWEANKYVLEHILKRLNKELITEGSVVPHHADNV